MAGTVLAVKKAHESLAPGSLSLGNTTVLNANINRSPSAYLANPAEERARYQYDQDKDMSLLRFDDASGNARGFLSFFPVHGTSLYEVCVNRRLSGFDWPTTLQNNTLVSGDNKGMAAYMYELSVEPNSMPGNNTLVAGFTQGIKKTSINGTFLTLFKANVGDTSPNTLGPVCQSPGQPWNGQACDFDHSTCGMT